MRCPTPPAAPWTSSQEPSGRPSRSRTCSAVPPASGSVAASTSSRPAGRGAMNATSTAIRSAYAPQRVPRTGSSPHTGSPTMRSVGAPSSFATVPANSYPTTYGLSTPDHPGVRAVAEIHGVDPRGLDRHHDLPSTRHRIGQLSRLQGIRAARLANDDRPHAPTRWLHLTRWSVKKKKKKKKKNCRVGHPTHPIQTGTGDTFSIRSGVARATFGDMADRPERVCVPLETEMLPLYREPPGSARLRREQKREQRRDRRGKAKAPTRAERMLARLASAASTVTRRRHA